MEARELRIGNLLHDREGRLCIVEQVGLEIDDCKIYSKFGPTTGLPVIGIPLTEEWLLKFGFHYNNNTSSVARLEIQYKDSDFPVTLQATDNGASMLICRNGIGTACAPCEYIYQLQNLYFALTGQELTIK